MSSTGQINHEYLEQLLQISLEQNENDLVPHLMRSLKTEHGNFLLAPPGLIETEEARKSDQQRIHKLKSNYFNLGCEGVGHILEDMYQALKSAENLPKIKELWPKFLVEAESTFEALQKEINAGSH